MTNQRARRISEGLAVFVIIALLLHGCTAKPYLPEVGVLRIPGCDLEMPLSIAGANTSREAFAVAGPVLTCRILHILKDRMDARPVTVDWILPLDDIQQGDWDRIAGMTFQRMPPVPPPPIGVALSREVAERSKPRLQLCGDIPKRKRLVCVTISEEGTAPMFGGGIRETPFRH